MSIFATTRTVESLTRRLEEMSVEIDTLKRASRSLELEFTELYDKVRHQMSRMAKRAAVNAKENGEILDDAPPAPPENEIDPISASILRRRGIRRQAN